MGYVIFWIILSIVVGAIGGSRKIGFGGAFILSLLLSPLIGLIITVISPSKASIELNAQLLKAQERTNELLSNKPSNSVSEEIRNLQQLRANGTLTEEEYERLRSRIVDGKP